MKSMRRFLSPSLLITLLTLAPAHVPAQQSSSDRSEIVTIGGIAQVAFERLRASFAVGARGELTSQTACGRFESGSGTLWSLGLRFDRPYDTRIRFGIDIEASGRSGELRFPCIDPAEIRLPDGTITQALTDHVARLSSSSIRAFPWIAYIPWDVSFRVSAGVALSTLLAGEYEVREDIVFPSSASFLGGGQSRRYGAGSLLDFTTPISSGAHVGLSWRLRAGRKLSLDPMLRCVYWFGDEVGELGLRRMELGVSLGVLYRLDRRQPPVIVSSDGQGPGGASVSLVTRSRRSDGTLSDTLSGTRIRRLSTKLHPLLAYLFFDTGDSAIPSRYRHGGSRSAESFTESSLEGLSTLGMYYCLLDIIGSRMVRFPTATLQIVAHGPDASSEAEARELAWGRGRGVMNYLAYQWRIDTSRLSVIVRRTPLAPSSEETVDGAAENRRVELISDDPEVTAPIVFVDTVQSVEWDQLSIDVGIESSSWISTWSLEAGNRVLKSGAGLDGRLVENVVADGEDVVGASERVPVSVRYETEDGETGIASDYLPVVIRSDNEARLGTGSYSLILFDFYSSALRSEHLRTLRIINQGTDPRASARVAGYTDRLGAAELNRRLSEERAREVARLLTMTVEDIVGRGESEDLYDNSLPEGRFYSRSVTIVTRLPED